MQAVRNLLVAPRWAVSARWRRAQSTAIDPASLTVADTPAAGPGGVRASNESAAHSAQGRGDSPGQLGGGPN
jgi:hypothetical protein